MTTPQNMLYQLHYDIKCLIKKFEPKYDHETEELVSDDIFKQVNKIRNDIDSIKYDLSTLLDIMKLILNVLTKESKCSE